MMYPFGNKKPANNEIETKERYYQFQNEIFEEIIEQQEQLYVKKNISYFS